MVLTGSLVHGSVFGPVRPLDYLYDLNIAKAYGEVLPALEDLQRSEHVLPAMLKAQADTATNWRCLCGPWLVESYLSSVFECVLGWGVQAPARSQRSEGSSEEEEERWMDR